MRRLGVRLRPLDFFHAGVGAQGGGNVGEVAGVVDVDVDVDVEEVALAVVHAQVDDVAAGLADDGADLAQHARGVADGGGEAGAGDGVALRLGSPLQVAPELLAVLVFGQLLAVDG